jgi:hypothetical protein
MIVSQCLTVDKLTKIGDLCRKLMLFNDPGSPLFNDLGSPKKARQIYRSFEAIASTTMVGSRWCLAVPCCRADLSCPVHIVDAPNHLLVRSSAPGGSDTRIFRAERSARVDFVRDGENTKIRPSILVYPSYGAKMGVWCKKNRSQIFLRNLRETQIYAGTAY